MRCSPRRRTRRGKPLGLRYPGRILLATATHAVCPLCGKSSSLQSFPSGGGGDIILQTFRGLGRGKGFTVESRTSGLQDVHICTAVKPKVVEILAKLADHGYVAPDDLVRVVKPLRLHLATDEERRELESLRARVKSFDAELRLERGSRDFLERELHDAEIRLKNEKDARIWAELRAQEAYASVEDTRKAMGRVIAAYGQSIRALRKLQEALRDTPYAEETVRLTTHNLAQMLQIVEELRALRIIKSATRRGPDQAQ